MKVINKHHAFCFAAWAPAHWRIVNVVAVGGGKTSPGGG